MVTFVCIYTYKLCQYYYDNNEIYEEDNSLENDLCYFCNWIVSKNNEGKYNIFLGYQLIDIILFIGCKCHDYEHISEEIYGLNYKDINKCSGCKKFCNYIFYFTFYLISYMVVVLFLVTVILLPEILYIIFDLYEMMYIYTIPILSIFLGITTVLILTIYAFIKDSCKVLKSKYIIEENIDNI